MRIPTVQERLRDKAAQHGDPEIAWLADQLSRRKPKRVAPAQSEPMTDELRGQIRRYANSHPHATQAQMAARFNVNSGRISEALRGFRT